MLRILGIALLCLAALTPTRVQADARSVVVKQGDALITIARRHGITVEQIKRWNSLRSDMIRIGDKLVVAPPPRTRSGPQAKRPTTPPKRAADEGIDWTPPFDYGAAPQTSPTERAGAIAARDPSTAVAVRTTKQPAPKKNREVRTYRVQKGDTLSEIALRHLSLIHI